MSANVKTKIIPSQKKKKLIYTLVLLFFGSLLFSLLIYNNLQFYSFLKNMGWTAFIGLWLGIFFAPASPLIIFLLVPHSLVLSLLIAAISTANAGVVILWWLSLVKDEWSYCWYIIRPVFVWLSLGFCSTAFSLAVTLGALG